MLTTDTPSRTATVDAAALQPAPAELPPAWVERLLDAYESYPETWNAEQSRPYLGRDDPAPGLLAPLIPLLADARRQLEADANRMPREQLDPAGFLASYFESLPHQLLVMVSRTMVQELHVARALNQLEGERPEDRYEYFLESLRRRGTALEWLGAYPVLARQVQQRVEQWLANGRLFLEELQADWPRLTGLVPPEQRGPVRRVEVRGDRHGGGKAVMTVQLGGGGRVVYKPKSLAVDCQFQRLIAWLNDRGLSPRLRTLKILDRGNRGWIEYVEPQACDTAEQTADYFRRQGVLLALTYLLGGTDFHHENVLPVGEHPLLIDLEALLCPDLRAREPSDARGRAKQQLEQSVLRTGLLPQAVWGQDQHAGIDLSGMGAARGQAMPFTAPAWEDAGTDRMRLVRKQAWFTGGRNRVRLGDVTVDPSDYVTCVEEGFERACQLLQSQRDALLDPRGPLQPFGHVRVRVLLRSTQTYGRLWSETFHPDLLREEASRDEAFRRLRHACAARPELTPVVPHEIRDLRRGDFPLFTTRGDSLDLWTADGSRLPRFFARSGLDCVKSRLRQLDDATIAREKAFIQAAFAPRPAQPTAASGADLEGTSLVGPRVRLETPPAANESGLRERLLAAARRIVEQLERLAVRGRNDVTWLGPAGTANRSHPAPLEPDLYDGLPGVALFLGQFGELTGDAGATELARRAVRTTLDQLHSSSAIATSPGALAGWAGVVYCLTHLGCLWQRDDLLDEARRVAVRHRGTIDNDQHYDIVGGSAGAIHAVLGLHSLRPSTQLLDIAARCGERLLSGARPMPRGIGWTLPDAPQVALAGYAHGAAGIAVSLLSLADVTGDARYRRAAQDALEYERSCFCEQRRNWLDKRPQAFDSAANLPSPTAWCHGAPGIGMARLAGLPCLDDRHVRREIDTAVRTTIRHGFGHNHSLCHGDLGNAELLLLAVDRLADPRAASFLSRLTLTLLDDLERGRWICGSRRGLRTVGLMTGLAGIGYGLLRLAAPRHVPSVLTLESPRASRPRTNSTNATNVDATSYSQGAER